MYNTKKNLTKRNTILVLDLDETLIHSAVNEDPSIELPPYHYEYNSRIRGHIRPFLREFLEFASQNFTYVGIWTAATAQYAEFIVNTVLRQAGFEPAFVLSSNDCSIVSYKDYYGRTIRAPTKMLKKIWDSPEFAITGANPSNTLIVDDKVESAMLNLDNWVQIVPFRPLNKAQLNNDKELLRIIQVLIKWKKDNGFQ